MVISIEKRSQRERCVTHRCAMPLSNRGVIWRWSARLSGGSDLSVKSSGRAVILH